MKVSILIPCYNVEEYLPHCLQSIIDQTYSDLQIVAIDDGSKDNTWNILQDYSKKDSRIELYHQSNQGVASTRNNLLDKVKGDYILFVDADDWLELDMVSRLVSYAIESNSDLVMCDRVMNDDDVAINEINISILNREQAIKDFLRHEYFVGSLWNKLIKSELIQGLTFRNDIWYGEDALFCWSVLLNVEKILVTNERFYHYRQNINSISHQTFNSKKLTGHKVWEIITTETKTKWPELYDLARGAFAKSDYYLLMAASQGNYHKDDNIRLLQNNLRKNFKFLKLLIGIDIKYIMSAAIIKYCYKYGFYYYKLYNLKKLLLS